LRRFLFCLCLLPLAFPALVRADEPKSEKGVWTPTELTAGGQAVPADQLSAMKLTLGDGKYKVEVNDQTIDAGTYTVDTKKKPWQLVITGSDGPNKDKKILAISEVSGDTMKVCYDPAGKEYPKDFKSTKENKYLLILYKKQK